MNEEYLNFFQTKIKNLKLLQKDIESFKVNV